MTCSWSYGGLIIRASEVIITLCFFLILQNFLIFLLLRLKHNYHDNYTEHDAEDIEYEIPDFYIKGDKYLHSNVGHCYYLRIPGLSVEFRISERR